MPDMLTKEYTNGEVTVVWKPDVCIHSTICWKGLIKVFNPKKRPWVDMAGASTQEITDQVNKCPSGALSWYRNNDRSNATEVSNENGNRVEVTVNGPLLIHGHTVITHADGSVESRDKVTALCRCGASSKKPFCDGTHKNIGFTG